MIQMEHCDLYTHDQTTVVLLFLTTVTSARRAIQRFTIFLQRADDKMQQSLLKLQCETRI